MLSRKLLNRLIILTFFVLIGYCIGRSLASANLVGIVLALVSLGSGIAFLYLLVSNHPADSPESASGERS
ncbi:MAG TPA: hypothetical protein VG870_08565 [Chitinophagaceae bacterium]|nr:hypothetical protein [Chitinophagaceae bacterium]